MYHFWYRKYMKIPQLSWNLQEKKLTCLFFEDSKQKKLRSRCFVFQRGALCAEDSRWRSIKTWHILGDRLIPEQLL